MKVLIVTSWLGTIARGCLPWIMHCSKAHRMGESHITSHTWLLDQLSVAALSCLTRFKKED
jgi:hypothetical protein